LQQQRPGIRIPDAYAASRGSTLSRPFLSYRLAGGGQLLGDHITNPEEDLVGRLTLECRMWHHFVVGFDVELDEPIKRREVVQRLNVEPRVF